MRESEIASRLREAGIPQSGGVFMVSERPTVFCGPHRTPEETGIAKLARALGVPVEPDERSEPSLPQSITRTASWCERQRIGSVALSVVRVEFRGTGASRARVVLEYRDMESAALADALFAAYNSRPIWRARPREDARAGWYAVFFSSGRFGAAFCSAWDWTIVVGGESAQIVACMRLQPPPRWAATTPEDEP